MASTPIVRHAQLPNFSAGTNLYMKSARPTTSTASIQGMRCITRAIRSHISISISRSGVRAVAGADDPGSGGPVGSERVGALEQPPLAAFDDGLSAIARTQSLEDQ